MVYIYSILVHKYKKQNYIIQLVALASYMIIFSGILGIVITLSIWILITAIIYLIKTFSKKKKEKIPFGFYLCIINIVFMIFINFIQYYILIK